MTHAAGFEGSASVAWAALLGWCLSAFPAPAFALDPFQESAGQVVIEAEHPDTITGSFTVKVDSAASNGECIVVSNGTGSVLNSNGGNGAVRNTPCQHQSTRS